MLYNLTLIIVVCYGLLQPPKHKSSLERPLRSMMKAAWGLKDCDYWERLKRFKLYSNERRMEHYLCIHVWKSLNGYVPLLWLKWSEYVSHRNGPALSLSILFRLEGTAKTAMMKSVRYQGTLIINSLPECLMRWRGMPDSFKKKYMNI